MNTRLYKIDQKMQQNWRSVKQPLWFNAFSVSSEGENSVIVLNNHSKEYLT